MPSDMRLVTRPECPVPPDQLPRADLTRAGYDWLMARQVSRGFAKEGVPIEQAVDNSLAEEIVREDPPPL